MKPWKEVEEALGRDAAQKLREETRVELEAPEFAQKVKVAMAHGEEIRYDGEALFVLGPSGVGKSRVVLAGEVETPPGCLILDGVYIREASASWKKALDLAKANNLAGFSDYFDKYFKPPNHALKDQISRSAIESRANVIVPDTASNLKQFKATLDSYLSAGYKIKCVGVYASYEACQARGLDREIEEGKKFSSAHWKDSVEALFALQQHLAERKSHVALEVINNTDKLHSSKISLDALRILIDTSFEKSVWCETRLLLGEYADKHGNRFGVMPLHYEEETIDITLKQVANNSAKEMTFQFSSCALKDQHGNDAYKLRLAKGNDAGRVYLEGKQQSLDNLNKIGSLQGYGNLSLACEIDADAALRATAKDCDFLSENFRDFTDEEFELVAEAVCLRGKNAAPVRGRQPKALLILGPSAAGKTTISKIFAPHFDMNREEAVLVDSSVFRDLHPQYKSVCDNGASNHGIWYRAWPAVKDISKKTKDKIVQLACSEKKDLLISETGSEIPKMTKSIQRLMAQGYIVNICSIFAEPAHILSRGVAREMDEGKKYNRDLKKLQSCFDAIAPAIKSSNGRYCIVRNAKGQAPELYMKGECGHDIIFNLSRALAWIGEEVPESVELDPKELQYIMEGNMNVVCSYNGSDSGWQGNAIRCRKEENGRYLENIEFIKRVAQKMLGPEYVDAGKLVSLTCANIQALDESIFALRPQKRQQKRLDTKLGEGFDRILAMKVQNLMAAPVKSKCVTAEIKPKCGLVERPGLPSRYQLLQYDKLSRGKIRKISGYDPVKLFSKDPQRIYETLKECISEPQNNFRVFIDSKSVFSEEDLAKNPASTVQNLEAQLRQIGISGVDALLSVLAGVMSSPTMAVPSRLKRLQCWACGETAHLALQLYRSLKAQHHHETNDILSNVENFELALENLEDFPCDEAGIIYAVQEMDKVMAHIHESSWNAEIEREVVTWLTRFLIGRTAHDVSILINFVHIPVEPMSPELEQQLKSLRFQPLDFIGLPGSLSWTGLWFRVSVVDTDPKHADKIPEWSTQLEDYSNAYFKRFESQSTPSGSKKPVIIAQKGEEAIGGHADAIRFDGDVIWKRDAGGRRGLMEFTVLREALEIPGAKNIISELVGYQVDAGGHWIGMKNMTFGLTDPAILDIKIGTRTWNTDAPEKKVESQQKKAMTSTTGTLGVRVVGAKFKIGDDFVKVGNKCARDVNNEQELVEFFAQFLPTEELRTSALAKVRDIQKWWEGQSALAFYASSLLFAYDTQKLDMCKVGLIDFANAESIKNKADDLSGFGTGLETLTRIISSLK